jgi:hypothetical protein
MSQDRRIWDVLSISPAASRIALLRGARRNVVGTSPSRSSSISLRRIVVIDVAAVVMSSPCVAVDENPPTLRSSLSTGLKHPACVALSLSSARLAL